ncbi:prophage antirepressor-like protein [Hydrogenispora ethanolica]|uniref:Prophage antirepressor-like protein n=1 Tax=Hydrogenispora ethanolica TaxID=1082276 RepID=A0A4R1S4Z2_HYDET|nr:phage antirepressor [Hydrogenispora ethanolica]TCL74189.1 prophage antirepressor-like protein [Hydrogenispora ethanolica]
MNKLQIFQKDNFKVRVVERNGEPWFVAKDVCDILEIGNPTMALQRLNNSMKGVSSIETLGGTQVLNVISEAGVYKLVFTSRKPEAERFTDWVASEVIPSIRKHGAYLTPAKIEEVLLNPDTIIRLATDLKQERQKRIELEEKIEDQKSKVLFADAVTTSKSSVLVGELAKILKQNGIEIGQNRLFEWLREEGYLCKAGENYNLPTQYSMELELMEIKKVTINNPDGSSRITRTPKITGKGQVYFVNKFLNKLPSTGTEG